MRSCFNPFPSLGKVFWLAGSLLIIGLASVVNPTIGWRWLIRIASIPGILLILVFKVGRARLSAPHHGPGITPGTKRHCPPPPASLGLSLCLPFTTAALSPRGLGKVLMAWGGCRPAAGETSPCRRWLGFALLLQSLWLCCPAVSLQHPRDKVTGQASRRRQVRQGIEKKSQVKYLRSSAGHSVPSSVFTFARAEERSLSIMFTKQMGVRVNCCFPRFAHASEISALDVRAVLFVESDVENPHYSAHGHSSAELWRVQAMQM